MTIFIIGLILTACIVLLVLAIEWSRLAEKPLRSSGENQFQNSTRTHIATPRADPPSVHMRPLRDQDIRVINNLINNYAEQEKDRGQS